MPFRPILDVSSQTKDTAITPLTSVWGEVGRLLQAGGAFLGTSGDELRKDTPESYGRTSNRRVSRR